MFILQYFEIFNGNNHKKFIELKNKTSEITLIYSKKEMAVNTNSLIRGHANKTETLNTSLILEYNEIKIKNSTNYTSNTYLLQILLIKNTTTHDKRRLRNLF